MRELILNREALNCLAALVISRGGVLSFVASGSSMWPIIHHNDTLRVAQSGAVRLGDVALARLQDGRIVAHRAVRILRSTQRDPVIMLKGDSCRTPDGYIETSDILGTVVAVDRDGFSVTVTTLAARAVGLLSAYLTPWILAAYHWVLAAR